MMNIREKNFGMTFLVGVSTIAALTLVGLTQFDALAQNATTTANQTGVQGFGNLTSAWLDTLESDLSAARDAVHGQALLDAYSTLGHADVTLFAIATDPNTGAQMTTLLERFEPLDGLLTEARNALQNNDTATALGAINNADSELLKLNQQLPPG